MTVLGASLMNIPISSTHCKVGSVVFTGRVRAKDSVDWSLFRNIGLAWILTVPITCGIAALCQVILKLSFSYKGIKLNCISSHIRKERCESVSRDKSRRAEPFSRIDANYQYRLINAYVSPTWHYKHAISCHIGNARCLVTIRGN